MHARQSSPVLTRFLYTYLQDAHERCKSLPKLVQAYVACPSAAESMLEASTPWQLVAYEAESSSPDALLFKSLAYVSAKSPCTLAAPSKKMCSLICARPRVIPIYLPTCWCDAGSVLNF